jgi:hypothetical protein
MMTARRRSQSPEGLRSRRGKAAVTRVGTRHVSETSLGGGAAVLPRQALIKSSHDQVAKQRQQSQKYEKKFRATLDFLRSKPSQPHAARDEHPVWVKGKAPGTKVMEFASMGDITLYVAALSRSQRRLSPEYAPEYQWVLISEAVDTVSTGGGAESLDRAKEYASKAYLVARGLDGRTSSTK